MTVPDTDGGFYTDGCGAWFPWFPESYPAMKTPSEPTTPGDWRPFVDMADARWIAYPSEGSPCYWERSRDWLHELSSIINNHFSTSGPAVVQFEPGDVGFTSSGCGVWQRMKDDDPRGVIDGFSQGFDTVAVNGWALDPNATNDPIDVDIYVDGQYAQRTLANTSRPDVGTALGVSNQHGWSANLNLSQGAHTVCVYGLGVGLGGYNPKLGCRSVSYDGNPRGNFEHVTGGTTLTVSGWALDPSTATSIPVDVYVDGGFAARLTANQDRPDIGAAYPGFGANHGYNAQLNTPDGVHQVCTYAINVMVGNTNPSLGCRTVAVQGNPLGNVDGLSAGLGTITASGWSFDPDTAAPIHVHVYLDGTFAADLTANQSWPDVANVYPAYGAAYGFRATLPVASGPHTICAYGINVGGGSTNPLLACRAFTIDGNPSGNLESASVSAGKLSVAGWAIDPDTTGPIGVQVYVDGQYAAVLTANTSRADLGTAFPAFGPSHGFAATTIPIGPGSHRVCAYAINTGRGTSNPQLGCIRVQ